MTPTKAEALAALDDMDDCARMDCGVDAVGPRSVLRRFIESVPHGGVNIDNEEFYDLMRMYRHAPYVVAPPGMPTAQQAYEQVIRYINTYMDAYEQTDRQVYCCDLERL